MHRALPKVYATNPRSTLQSQKHYGKCVKFNRYCSTSNLILKSEPAHYRIFTGAQQSIMEC